MPSLDSHQSGETTKLLLIGDSGTGKTGALASLIEAGYNLRILDFDNGLDILANIIRKRCPDKLKNVNYVTLTDKTTIAANGANIITQAKAWPEAIKTLKEWPDGLGPITTWGPRDVLVVDSLTFAGKAAVRFTLSLSGRTGQIPQFQDYRDAQILLEKLCAQLYDTDVKCNVIVLSHVREVARKRTEMDSKGRPVTIEEEGSRRGYAETGAGSAFSPQVGRFFNAVLLADIMGSGQSAKRIIRTTPHDTIGVKHPAPGLLPATLPIETGLATYFETVRKGA